MPCYDERSTASYVEEHEVIPLRREVRRLQARNNKLTKMLCDIGHVVESRPQLIAHDIMSVSGYAEWWEEHKRIDAELEADAKSVQVKCSPKVIIKWLANSPLIYHNTIKIKTSISFLLNYKHQQEYNRHMPHYTHSYRTGTRHDQ